MLWLSALPRVRSTSFRLPLLLLLLTDEAEDAVVVVEVATTSTSSLQSSDADVEDEKVEATDEHCC